MHGIVFVLLVSWSWCQTAKWPCEIALWWFEVEVFWASSPQILNFYERPISNSAPIKPKKTPSPVSTLPRFQSLGVRTRTDSDCMWDLGSRVLGHGGQEPSERQEILGRIISHCVGCCAPGAHDVGAETRLLQGKVWDSRWSQPHGCWWLSFQPIPAVRIVCWQPYNSQVLFFTIFLIDFWVPLCVTGNE